MDVHPIRIWLIIGLWPTPKCYKWGYTFYKWDFVSTHPKLVIRLWPVNWKSTPSLNEVHLVLEQLLAARLFGFVVHHRRVGSHRWDGVETITWADGERFGAGQNNGEKIELSMGSPLENMGDSWETMGRLGENMGRLWKKHGKFMEHPL